MKNILIVDDERSFLLSLADGLRMARKDFNILTAENGEKAIEILRAVNIDMLLTDLKMPVMDGFDLLMHVLKNNYNIPTIVFTAYANPDVIEKLNAMGFCFCMEKPVDFDNILNKTKLLLGVKD